MKKDKKYVKPKCVDFASGFSVRANPGFCTTGSAPSEDEPCWNGNNPTGYDGECSTGTTPTGGVCFDDGTTPS